MFTRRIAGATSLSGLGMLSTTTRRWNVTHFEGNPDSFKEMIKEGSHVVDFFTEWCGPCKAIAPKFEELSKSYTQVKFHKVNVDDLEDLAVMFNITSIPTFIGFKDGKAVKQIQGAQLDALKSLVDEVNAPKA